MVIDAAILHNIQNCSCSSGDVNVFQWNWRMILLSASTVRLWVQRDGGIRSFLTLEVVEETLLILQENLFDLLLELGVPVSKWVFSVPDLLPRILFVHLRLENEFSIFFGNITSCALSLWELISDTSIVSNSSMSVTNMSPLQIPPRAQSVSKDQSK